MKNVRQFLSSRRNIMIVAAATGVIILIAISLTVAALLRNETGTGTPFTSHSGKDISSGNVSGLSGGTSSQRNLKGLTLRINQIETCNPKLISAYVAASSDAGVVNKNFNKQDIKVYLDDKQITTFDFNLVDAVKTPITNVLVIDHSGSMQGAPMENAKSAAQSYIRSLSTNDQVGVVQFDDRIEVVQTVTTDKTVAENVVSGIQPRGDTAIFDAIATGVSVTPPCGRKAVTVLTDGNDTASVLHTARSAIDTANKANLPIFAVGIKGPDFNPAAIRQISDATGGQYLEANTPEEISNLYKNIDGQLTGQFVANLRLTIPKDGSTHRLRIVSTVEGSPTTSERSFTY